MDKVINAVTIRGPIERLTCATKIDRVDQLLEHFQVMGKKLGLGSKVV